MLSFQKMIEIMNEDSLLESEDSRNDEKCIAAIRAGLKIDEEFWDEFLRLCNNTEVLSHLFEIPKERMSKWPSRVRKYLELTKKIDGDEQAMNKKAKLISTGY
jgi:hypothetical protein